LYKNPLFQVDGFAEQLNEVAYDNGGHLINSIFPFSAANPESGGTGWKR
jgi:hypothetical protein